VTDRSQKFQAPDPIQPTGKFKTIEETIAQFTSERDKHTDFAKTTKEDLRNRAIPHPLFGTVDCYQWILFMSTHTKRHTLQIEEVKANPNFPKS
jgi:hypothetical protein